MGVLSARHLSKSFRSRQVVKDVSLNVHSGEIVGLLGPNGAGKTTSFHMIVGLIPSDAGTIHLNNEEISNLPMDRRSLLGLGYLPQESSVFRRLTVAENIMAILQTRPQLDENRAKKRLANLMNEFHISHLADNLGASLSGGERRRVEIARALASEPQFLLLDEPFAGIDPISINDIQRITRYLSHHGIGILVTDHNVREALGTCDRAYIVNDGRIIAEGTPDIILDNRQVREVYLGEQFNL
ncbi:MAG TPA: LPS export ABC transporter ATP-binding protein [Gammaproteobacteria bacterium]|nr:LPS export ABC transporter ATP-binding protein [Gammaproteobacteria bacterium]